MKYLIFLLCFIFFVYVFILRRIFLLKKHKNIKPIELPGNICITADLKNFLLKKRFHYPDLIQIEEDTLNNELLLVTKIYKHRLTIENSLLYIDKLNHFNKLNLNSEKSCDESFVIHAYLENVLDIINLDTHKEYRSYKNIAKYKIVAFFVIITAIASAIFFESDYYSSKGITASYLDYSDSITIGKAFKEFFSGSDNWKSFKADGDTYVNYTGHFYNTDNEFISALVQFKITDNKKPELHTIKFNDQPLSSLEVDEFLTDIFNSKSNNGDSVDKINDSKNNPEDIVAALYNSYLTEYSNTDTIGEVFDYYYKNTAWSTCNIENETLIKLETKFFDEYSKKDVAVTYTFKIDEENGSTIDKVFYNDYRLPQYDIDSLVWIIYYDYSVRNK